MTEKKMEYAQSNKRKSPLQHTEFYFYYRLRKYIPIHIWPGKLHRRCHLYYHDVRFHGAGYDGRSDQASDNTGIRARLDGSCRLLGQYPFRSLVLYS